MVKALTGNLALDSGELLFQGNPVEITSPQQASAARHGGRLPGPRPGPAPQPGAEHVPRPGAPRRGILGHLGFMDEKAMRASAEQSFAELGGTVRSFTAPIGSMSGGQRQQVAIARAISWADKLVFLDEPTAALGVVQTKNVLESIKRVKAKGIAVVLISHSMPHVHRGRRPRPRHAPGHPRRDLRRQEDQRRRARRRHDRRPRQAERSSSMSVIAHDEQDVVVKDPDEGHPSLIKRLANTQSVWILGVLLVIIAFFSITGGTNFLSVSNFSLIAQNVAVWAVLGIGMTFVIITSGIDLSVGSVLVFSSVVAAKAMEAMGGGAGSADGRHPRSPWSAEPPGAASTASWWPRPRSLR